MKHLATLFGALLIAVGACHAADPVKIDIYLDGKLQQQATLKGPNSVYKFWLDEEPGTILELQLVAPEPIIVDLKETATGRAAPNALGRAKLVGRGGQFAVSEPKGESFKHPYVLVRPE